MWRPSWAVLSCNVIVSMPPTRSEYFGEWQISCRRKPWKHFFVFNSKQSLLTLTSVLTRLILKFLNAAILLCKNISSDQLVSCAQLNNRCHSICVISYDMWMFFGNFFLPVTIFFGRTPNCLLSPPVTSLTVNPSRHLPRQVPSLSFTLVHRPTWLIFQFVNLSIHVQKTRYISPKAYHISFLPPSTHPTWIKETWLGWKW